MEIVMAAQQASLAKRGRPEPPFRRWEENAQMGETSLRNSSGRKKDPHLSGEYRCVPAPLGHRLPHPRHEARAHALEDHPGPHGEREDAERRGDRALKEAE